jgi:hypothetical protein
MREPAFRFHPIVSRSLLGHALTAWAASAVLLLGLDALFRLWVASALFTLLAPGVSALVAARYFLRHGAQEALSAALWFTGVALVLDLLLGGLVRERMELTDPAFGFELPLILVFGATGLIGEMLPGVRQSRSA